MQGARLDHGEVGDQRAHLGHVLHPADEIRQRRMVLVHDRSAGRVGLAHQDVDPVTAEAGAVALPETVGLAAPPFRLDQAVHVVHEVGAHRLEVLAHRGQRRELCLQLLDRVSDGEFRDLLVQFAQASPALLVPAGPEANQRLELALQLLDLCLDLRALLLRELLELLRAEQLAVAHGRHAEAGRRADDGDALCLGLLAERLRRLLLALAEFLVDGLAAVLVVLALEGRRDGRPQFVDQPVHGVPEFDGAPGRQADGARPVRGGEVVDVNPVLRGRLLRGAGAQFGEDGGVLAGARRAEREQVVAGPIDARAERERLERALLADHDGTGLEFPGRLEAEGVRCARAVQLCRRNPSRRAPFLRHGHSPSLGAHSQPTTTRLTGRAGFVSVGLRPRDPGDGCGSRRACCRASPAPAG
jgi:hypothetical protein